MKLPVFRLVLTAGMIALSSSAAASGFRNQDGKKETQDTTSIVSPFYEDNERCFRCHGQERYEYMNDNLGTQVKAFMCENGRIVRDDFYSSNHKYFSCTDCHSSDYVTFPHPGQLRMEQMYTCIDCHGGDEKFAKFSFEEIETEYQKSTHFSLEKDGFTCWKCHNPHSYKISIRNTENLKETIVYDNTICLSCHSDFRRFQLLSDLEEINILEKHDWLPNQASHFGSVRCIECHTMQNDTILVAHLIRPKEDAVKQCNECHSKNSLLMATLYKFQSREQRRDGFVNGIILNESYVIGANRNRYLDILSLVIFGVVILIIGIHIFFRTK